MRDPVPPHVRRRWLVAQAGLLALVAAPIVLAALDRTYLLPVMTRMLAYGLAAAALDLVLGYGGLVSFGHGAFLGTGAYVAGVLLHHAGQRTPVLTWPIEIGGTTDALLAFPAAAIAAGALAFVIGAISLRTRGVHFIMITLAFAQMVYFLVLAIPDYGGTDGLMLPMRNRILEASLDGDQPLYWLALVLLVGFLIVTQRMMEARFGLALRAIIGNPLAAHLVGIDVRRSVLLAFAGASAVGGAAGFLVLAVDQQVTPMFGMWATLKGLIAMMIGGLGSVPGAVVGGLLLGIVETNSQWYFGPQIRDLAAYLVLFAFLVLRPRGLLGRRGVMEA